jgi:hypothetical protein
MTQTNRFLICVAGILLVCLLAIGTVSAYDPDTACTSLKEIIAGSGDLQALELVYDYSDGSVGCMKLWIENTIDPDETLCNSLKEILNSKERKVDFSRIVFTTVAGDARISYELSPEKSVFLKIPKAVKFPDLGALTKEFGSTLPDVTAGLKLDYGPFHDFNYTLNGNSVTYWAESWTNPSTTLPVMTAETRILKKSGFRWVDSCYSGNTEFYVTNIETLSVSPPLPTGTYKQTAHFEGYKADYSWYEEDRENPNQFTI